MECGYTTAGALDTCCVDKNQQSRCWRRLFGLMRLKEKTGFGTCRVVVSRYWLPGSIIICEFPDKSILRQLEYLTRGERLYRYSITTLIVTVWFLRNMDEINQPDR